MAGEAVARAEAARLKAIMEKWGVRCSIELQQGRGEWFVTKWLRMHHHTVSRPSMGLTPALRICKEGRSDVPGPLCNGYGGYDLVYRIITMGLANHPGQGGPITIDGIYVPQDSARTPTWGTEWEGGLEPWTPEFVEFMGRADCALAEYQGRPLTSQLEHSTWTTRKIDRLGYTRADGIKLTEYWSDREGDDSMSAAEVADIKNHVNQQVIRLGHFLATGKANALFNPKVVEWMNAPSTTTLNEVAGQNVYYGRDGESRIWAIRSDHTGKVHLTGTLWEWLKTLALVSGDPVPAAVTMADGVLDSIPTTLDQSDVDLLRREVQGLVDLVTEMASASPSA